MEIDEFKASSIINDLADAGLEVIPAAGQSTGSFKIGKDGQPEQEIIMCLDPAHPTYVKFVRMLDNAFKKQKGLIKYISGV